MIAMLLILGLAALVGEVDRENELDREYAKHLYLLTGHGVLK